MIIVPKVTVVQEQAARGPHNAYLALESPLKKGEDVVDKNSSPSSSPPGTVLEVCAGVFVRKSGHGILVVVYDLSLTGRCLV